MVPPPKVLPIRADKYWLTISREGRLPKRLLDCPPSLMYRADNVLVITYTEGTTLRLLGQQIPARSAAV
jgi:hypothetical protein